MSKLASDLRKIIEANRDENTATMVAEIMASGKSDERLPGFSACSQQSKKEISVLLRSAKYHFAGAAPWENGRAAIEATAAHMEQEMVSMMIKTLTIGVEIGYHQLKIGNIDYAEMIGDSTFHMLIGFSSMKYRADDEVTNTVNELLADTVAHVANMLGFTEVEGKATSHIWDMWYAALGSSSLAMYLAGIHLGRNRYEDEVLDSIVQATQQSEE